MVVEQYWEEMVAKFEASGLTQIAFSKQQQLKIHTFKYWLNKIKSNPQVGSFIKLELPNKQVSTFEIEYPNGVKLRPQGTPSSQELRFLISLF